MAKNLPSDIDLFFLIGAILIFLLINYSMPLSTVYSFIVILGAMMYLVPIQFNFFRWIPLSKPGPKWPKIIIGIIFGIAFIYFYNQISDTPMAAIFATTLFGESEFMTKIVYSGLIPPIETVFFFVTLLTWWAWKIGDSINVSPFSVTGIKLMAIFGAVFVLFHATSKGITNTADLFATFAFGALSIGMILYFQEAIQAIFMHVTVNGWSMKIFETMQNWIASGSTAVIIIGAIIVFYLITNKKGIKVLA